MAFTKVRRSNEDKTLFGVVIGVGSEWPEMQPSGREWIAVSLCLRPGHSGGSLLDVHRRLVGITTMITGHRGVDGRACACGQGSSPP